MKWDEAHLWHLYLLNQAERLRKVYHLNPLAKNLEFLALKIEAESDMLNSDYMRDCLKIIADPYHQECDDQEEWL